MASLPNSQTVTYEEWLRMPEVSDAIEEVVNGHIRIMPAPKLSHARIVQRLYDAIRPQVDKRQVEVFTTQFDLITRRQPLTARIPDLAVIQTETMVEEEGRLLSAPQLLVEVLSPANTLREREEKLNDYAGIGVPEIWVVSQEERTVEVLYLEDGQFSRQSILAEGILKPLHFPDVQVVISEIWPD